MTKVYVVTQGEYSSLHVCGVFSTEEKAKELIAFDGGGKWEEYEIDNCTKFVHDGLRAFLLRMDKEGNTSQYIEKANINWKDGVEFYKNDKWAYFTVHARDEQHAIKIANELRAKMIAQDQWGL